MLEALSKVMLMFIPLIAVAIGIVLLIMRRSCTREAAWMRYLGLLLLSANLGTLMYFAASLLAARVRGDCHFYSLPIGGYGILSNASIFLSVLSWSALAFWTLTRIVLPKK